MSAPILPAFSRSFVLLDYGHTDVLHQRAAQTALHGIGQALYTTALEVRLFVKVKQDMSTVDKAIGGLDVVVKRNDVRCPSLLHRCQRLFQS